MELWMTVNESWVYQGRQGHGWFGNGTAPEDDDDSDSAAGATDLFRPANAGQRVDYVASSLIMHVPRNDRGRWNSAVSDSARANLKTAVAAWYGARAMDRDAFRTQFLDPYASDEVVDRLRGAAKGMVEGRTHDDLAKAGDDLAAAAQTVGVDGWPRFLGNASHQAVEAVSRGDVPGVMKVGAMDEPVGMAGLMFLGLLAIIFGGKPNVSQSLPAPSRPIIVQQEAPKDDEATPEGGDGENGNQQSWPANPDDLLKQGWIETSDLEAVKAGRRTFSKPETGEEIAFDRARPGQPGFEGRDHYHRVNPNSVGKRDANLDASGNPVPRGSKRSHIVPGWKQ